VGRTLLATKEIRFFQKIGFLARVGCVLRTGYQVPRRLVRGTHPTLAGYHRK